MCSNGDAYFAGCYDGNCYRIACENGHPQVTVFKADNSDPLSFGNYVSCAPVMNAIDQQRNILTHGNIITASYEENELNPFSMNEIRIEWKRFIPEARTWIRDEKSWFDNLSDDTADQSKFLERIKDFGVTQSHRSTAWSLTQKSMVNVLSADCGCANKTYRVYNRSILTMF